MIRIKELEDGNSIQTQHQFLVFDRFSSDLLRDAVALPLCRSTRRILSPACSLAAVPQPGASQFGAPSACARGRIPIPIWKTVGILPIKGRTPCTSENTHAHRQGDGLGYYCSVMVLKVVLPDYKQRWGGGSRSFSLALLSLAISRKNKGKRNNASRMHA